MNRFNKNTTYLHLKFVNRWKWKQKLRCWQFDICLVLWVDSQIALKELAVNFFRYLYSEDGTVPPAYPIWGMFSIYLGILLPHFMLLLLMLKFRLLFSRENHGKLQNMTSYMWVSININGAVEGQSMGQDGQCYFLAVGFYGLIITMLSSLMRLCLFMLLFLGDSNFRQKQIENKGLESSLFVLKLLGAFTTWLLFNGKIAYHYPYSL